MCGARSQWLGPKRRVELYGSEFGGAKRPGGNISRERGGYHRGAKVHSRWAPKERT
jgi:hypothetical protein